jgi:TRAP-type mannitol/chloroaromatic compound transport system permease large subunit
MAVGRGRLNMKLLVQALDNTTRLSVFVLFILVGSTVFSFTFNAADGHIWVEHLFKDMPGGAIGFLIVVNILIFILGCFIDFFEIAFIVVPILAPVADKMLSGLLPPGTPPEMTLIWFGVIIAMNLQTSFLTPPFGFALFYLRSVAAKKDYKDRITGETIPAVATSQIYKGSIAFIVLQLIMVAAVIMMPTLVTGGIEKVELIDADKALEQLQQKDQAEKSAAGQDAAASAAQDAEGAKEDPMKGLLESMKRDQDKK